MFIAAAAVLSSSNCNILSCSKFFFSLDLFSIPLNCDGTCFGIDNEDFISTMESKCLKHDNGKSTELYVSSRYFTVNGQLMFWPPNGTIEGSHLSHFTHLYSSPTAHNSSFSPRHTHHKKPFSWSAHQHITNLNFTKDQLGTNIIFIQHHNRKIKK